MLKLFPLPRQVTRAVLIPTVFSVFYRMFGRIEFQVDREFQDVGVIEHGLLIHLALLARAKWEGMEKN